MSRRFHRRPRELARGQRKGTHERKRRTGGEIGLYEQLARGHKISVCIRVETGRLDHKVHDGRTPPRRVKLVGGRRTTALVRGVDVGDVPVDVATGGEPTDEDDGAVAECLCGRVPAHVLHGEFGGVVVPLAVGVGQVVGRAWVENADRLAPVIVAIDVVVGRRRRRAIS